jgi:hypothetical protein
MSSDYGFALALADAEVVNGRGSISVLVAEGYCAPPRGVKRNIAACGR